MKEQNINNSKYRNYIAEHPIYFPVILHLTNINALDKNLLIKSNKTYNISKFNDNRVMEHFFYKNISIY